MLQLVVPVKSAVFPNVSMNVQVTARSVSEVLRTAKHFAGRNGIAAPVVDEHAVAVRYRQEVLAKNRPQMPGLNGNGLPFSRKRETLSDLYDEK